MTTATETHDTHAGDGEHAHRPDSYYFVVAAFLAFLTAAEVVLSYVGLDGAALMLPLGILMIIKFSTVAALFMHLKGDSRLFTRLFTTGIILAIIVYAIVFLAFDELF